MRGQLGEWNAVNGDCCGASVRRTLPVLHRDGGMELPFIVTHILFKRITIERFVSNSWSMRVLYSVNGAAQKAVQASAHVGGADKRLEAM